MPELLLAVMVDTLAAVLAALAVAALRSLVERVAPA